MKVVQFLRHPNVGYYSLERLHLDIRSNLTDDINVETRTNKYLSKGIFKRLSDAVVSSRHQGDVNHITGDVHYLSFFLRRNRTILTILDCVLLERSTGIKFWLIWFLWYWLPIRRCALILVISRATREQVLGYVNCDPGKVKVIHCNVSDDFKCTPKVFNAEFPRILHMGTSSNKNLERHIAALSGIFCTLVIVGELSQKEVLGLKDSGLSYENPKNLTSQQVIEEYINCDLLLFASTYEGFGMPIIEAQAVGRPVVTSNLWSMPEVAGDAAILVDPYDIESIKAGINMIIDSTEFREDLVRKGHENCKRFSAKEIGLQYTQTYQEVFRSGSIRRG